MERNNLGKNRGRGRRTMKIEKKDTEKNTAKTKEQQRNKKKKTNEMK